jgi:hypothetical protein
MKLNKFIWDIYIKSEAGKEAIRIFEECGTVDNDVIEIIDKYLGEFLISPQDASAFVDDLLDFVDTPLELNIEQAANLFEKFLSKGILMQFEDGEKEHYTKIDELLGLIPIISLWLYLKYPQFFKPYFFTNNKFSLLTQITDAFEIELPEVPLKRYKEDRFRYYWKLCTVFSKFQEENQLSNAEFCAFLYDFAPNYLEQNKYIEKELPQPTQVWLCGGDKGNNGDFNFLDNNSLVSQEHRWQGNVDTKKGDIIIMYCLAPRSYIHSIWRATSDGIADPFFHYYSSISIGEGQKITPITLNQLKEDEYFSKHPLIKKNLQGINGYSFNSEDYERIFYLIKKNGGDTSNLPKLYSPTFQSNQTLNVERDVEIEIIEPFLKELGYLEENWIRQLPVRMGKGERNFPDYAFLTDKRNKEEAFMLIEAKYWIKNNRELEDTFKQVWSYGLRLSSEILIIMDKNALWIYERHKNSFDRAKYLKKYWKELESPDEFNCVQKIIGKKK